MIPKMQTIIKSGVTLYLEFIFARWTSLTEFPFLLVTKQIILTGFPGRH